MKPVFLPQPSPLCFVNPDTGAPSAEILKWQTDVQQTTRQWLRAGGSITKWLDDYRRLRFSILYQNWQITVPVELRSKATFVLLGSSARGEDTLSSDLDYALLLPPHPISGADEFQPYLYQFSQVMAAFGIDPCPGNVMATNPRWIGTLETWKKRIDAYFQYPSWENTRYLFMLIDSLPICLENSNKPSAVGVWNNLRQNVLDRISQSPYLCWEMAHLGIESPAAVPGRLGGWFSANRFSPRTKSINIKASLINPMVHSLRLLSITNSISALSTLKRLDTLANKQVLDRTLRQGIGESLRWSWQMRLYGRLKAGANPANSEEIVLSSTTDAHREELLTHLQTTRSLVRIVHRKFRKPR